MSTPYRVERLLGKGGMGEVYLATDPQTGEQVALKMLRPEYAAESDFRRRFAREVDAARRVRGRSIARVVNADLEASQPWIAWEYVEGKTLALGRDGIDLRALAAGLARALADIHAAGVVHRDLTPANVILGADGPRVVDFGIAWYPEASTITRTGTALGTPAWMAPEQLGDDTHTPASDVWAWGAVMAYAATGRPPVTGSRPEVIQVRAARGQLDLDGVPAWLEPVVRRAMHPDPVSRPTAEALAAELGAPTDGALTEVLERTWVRPPGLEPTELAPTPSERLRLPAWVWRWIPGVVAAAIGSVIAATAGFLVVVITVTVLVLVGAVLRMTSSSRSPTSLSFALAGVVAAGVGLAQVLGLVGGIVALLAILAFLFAIGADVF